MLTPEGRNDLKEHEMFAALFAHLEATEGSKVDSHQAGARGAPFARALAAHRGPAA